MGGNDTHDKHARPYELDDSKEILYDRLEAFRDATNSFRRFMQDELDEAFGKCDCDECTQTNYILEYFDKYFSGCDY